MVTFDYVLDNGEYVLTYNYIAYNIYFSQPLFYYIIVQQHNLTRNKTQFIGADFFFIFDIALSKSKYLATLYPLIEIKGRDIIGSLTPYSYPDFLKLSHRGANAILDRQHMSKLIFNINKGNLHEMSKIFHINLESKKISKQVFSIKEYISKSLRNHVFIVTDLKDFINEIKHNVDKKVNKGHKQSRGRVTHMQFKLMCLDMDFINSLYHHNLRHLQQGNLEHYFLKDRLVDPWFFEYENFHINLGKKW